MSSLEIVGIITIIFVGGVIVSALILLIPMLKLIKKFNKISAKIDGQVVPAVERLNESTEKLNDQISLLNVSKDKITGLLGEVGEIAKEAKKLKNRPLHNLIGASFDILSMFKERKEDE